MAVIIGVGNDVLYEFSVFINNSKINTVLNYVPISELNTIK